MKLHTLLHYLYPFLPQKGENTEIESIENDNRKVQPGSLFICIKGYSVDGHDFAQMLKKRGSSDFG